MDARQDDGIWDAPVAEVNVKPGLQVCQHISSLQWEKTPIEFVELTQEFWENMKRLSSLKDAIFNVFPPIVQPQLFFFFRNLCQKKPSSVLAES